MYKKMSPNKTTGVAVNSPKLRTRRKAQKNKFLEDFSFLFTPPHLVTIFF